MKSKVKTVKCSEDLVERIMLFGELKGCNSFSESIKFLARLGLEIERAESISRIFTKLKDVDKRLESIEKKLK